MMKPCLGAYTFLGRLRMITLRLSCSYSQLFSSISEREPNKNEKIGSKYDIVEFKGGNEFRRIFAC
jgi:hypothetical protein